MAETHQVVSKVWIAEGCIVCDVCEAACAEVFEVRDETCVIRPQALRADFLATLTPSIESAARDCPVEVIKFEMSEVAGPAPAVWLSEAAELAHGETQGDRPTATPHPRWQKLIDTSRVGGAGADESARRSNGRLAEVAVPSGAAPDHRAALLAAGGAFPLPQTLSQRLRDASQVTRRHFGFALAIGWGALAACGVSLAAMFQDFLGPKVLREPKKVWRVGRPADFGNPGVYEQFKRTPDGGQGFWLVNLGPTQPKLVAVSVVCTHLGCIPQWLAGDERFKCPCHGSGFTIAGVNFEGPAPRPLERFGIELDADGFLAVDMTRVFRDELGQWNQPTSFVTV